MTLRSTPPTSSRRSLTPQRSQFLLAIVGDMTGRSDHFDGRRFFNPNGANGQPVWMVPRLLLTPRTRWPSAVPVEPRRPPTAGPDDVVVTFIGHATFLIPVAATNLLIDPVYAARASPVAFAGPRRVRAPGVRFDDLPTIALVLLSHNHYDHCDLGTLRALERRFHPLVVTPLGNGRLLRSAGIGHVERSEEHTSELQSRLHLVCRLLLEKKKKKQNQRIPLITGIHSTSMTV